MLRLPSLEPRWLDLPRGVRLLHRPVSEADRAAAASYARSRAAETVAEMCGRLGIPVPPEGEQDRARLGFATAALARLCILDWEGVEGSCTPDGAEALMRLPEMAAAYLEAALTPLAALSAEGNGCAPAPSGTTAGAPDTAATVPSPVSAAAQA